jgi:GNAT superfamily N-acetyltransferase
MVKVAYETLFDPEQADVAPVERGLHEYNLAHLGPDVLYNYHRLAILARDEGGDVIGGIHGELVWEWLYIQSLWVEENQRGHGIGRRLLVAIEQAAVAHGFPHSHLETTDFQALDFYRKQGYQVFGELEGKPAGTTWYYMKKDLQKS